MQKPGVTAPIIGARKREHLVDNIGAVSFRLSAEEMARLDAASAVEAPYPYGEPWNVRRDR